MNSYSYCTYQLYTCHKARTDALNAATGTGIIPVQNRYSSLKWKRTSQTRIGVGLADPGHLPLNRFIVACIDAIKMSRSNNKTRLRYFYR